MQIIIAICCVLIFILIPLGLLLISGKIYGDGEKLPIVILKFLGTLTVHFIASIFTPLIVLLIVIGADPKPGGKFEPTIAAQTVCLLIIAGYGFVGWLLCSFVNGRFVKSFSDFNLFSEKPQSIFPR